MPLPLQQAVSGTDGGITGAAKRWLVADLNIQEWFGPDGLVNRIRTGRLRRTPTSQPEFPTLLLSNPTTRPIPQSDRFHLQEFHLLATVYAIGENTCRWIGEYVTAILLGAHDQIIINNRGCTLVPDGDTNFALDEELSATAGDVWRYDARFKTISGFQLR